MASTDFTVADVLAWARTKPADEQYDYQSNGNCALCQFVRDTGRAANASFASSFWTAWQDRPYVSPKLAQYDIPDGIDEAASAGDWESEHNDDWTFGGLVRRLEKLCPATPVTASDWLSIDAYLSDIEQVSA